METLDVYFDYASPFGYIASEVLPGFAGRTSLSIRWKPIDLAQLSNYAEGLPYSPVKRNYVALDAARSAQFHSVPIRVPKPHPVHSMTALRLALVALAEPAFPDFHRALFRAAWRDQRDLSSREVLSDCITQVKGPVEEWLLQADLPETSKRLEMLTSEAEAKGVFGVPSMLLDGELFWGIASLPILEWQIKHRRSTA
jgi:2-hydroxychromene-2-carboxylate isomerase